MKRLAACVICAALLCSCVSTPEDTYSLRDVKILQRRGLGPDFGDSSVEAIREQVAREVASEINFYGIVIDEHGQPVTEHPVEIVLFDRLLEPFESPYYGWSYVTDIRTDKHGKFEVRDQRGSAMIISVAHEEFWDADEGRAQRVYYFSQERLQENTHSLPTAEAPAVFRMVSKPPEARTELVRLGSIVVPVGETVGIALDRPRYTVPLTSAELRVQLDVGDTDEAGQYDWRLSIGVPGGGIQPVHTLFTDQAPEDGYMDELVLTQEAGSSGWKHRDEIFCFLRTADGDYASLTIRARTREKAFLNIYGKRNPHGERYLD